MVDLASVVRPGDGIICGQACAEPQALLEALVASRAGLAGARLFLGASYSGIVRPEHADHLRLISYGAIGQVRVLAQAGVLEILPVPYSQLGGLIRRGKIGCDVVMLAAIETARVVVAEVNDQVPWTHGERVLRKEDFSLMVQSSRPPAAPPAPRRTGLEDAIGRHAAACVPEGATLEFGIGALPDAICGFLHNHRNLSVHSGTVGDGVLELEPRRIDCAMLIGSRRLFEFARENPAVRLRSSEYTHDAKVLSGIERFAAINSAVEVDLTGQVNSEVANGSYVGAVGGAPDFARAAGQSPGGVSIIMIPSSRIVERLGGPVTVPRSDAGIVVTEKGAADLRGCSLREREARLQKIAT
ncbi:MAG: acetyl-CoA hydrolase/transferase [Burkholderiales bacterium]|nr:acetyl-CoA hydrolase/transferase [Burkholderiales bacterium]